MPLNASGESEARPARAVALAALQTLQTGIFLVRAFYVLYGSATLEAVSSEDPAVVGRRLRIEAGNAVAIAVPAMIAAAGLWTGRAWAYWLCLAVTALAVISVIAMGTDGTTSPAALFSALLPLSVQFIFAVLPATRSQVLRQS